MADLRLVVLGCLFAFAQGQQICEKAQPGDILKACLFTPNCPVSTLDDVKLGLARDLKNLKHRLGGGIVAMLDCISTIETTGQSTKYDGTVTGTGCCDDKMVKNANGGKGCKKACDAVMRLLPYKNRC